MGLVTYVLWRLRFAFRPGLLFALYLVLAGAERFLIEFIRRNDDVALGLTQAQLISVAMILAGGVWLAVKANRRELRAAGPAPAAQT
jgi:phosphatidylglycerol:prolipoprotein diacylglycerol transferase